METCGSIDDIRSMISSLSCMIARIMCTEVKQSTVMDVKRHIYLFLTYFAKLDKSIDPNRKIPTWITCYNFLCLLNIPKAMEMFGPLRNLSELDIQGEGFIRYAKSEIPDASSKNWNYSSLGSMSRTSPPEREPPMGL